MSLPSRERGLKLVGKFIKQAGYMVAPLAVCRSKYLKLVRFNMEAGAATFARDMIKTASTKRVLRNYVNNQSGLRLFDSQYIIEREVVR